MIDTMMIEDTNTIEGGGRRRIRTEERRTAVCCWRLLSAELLRRFFLYFNSDDFKKRKNYVFIQLNYFPFFFFTKFTGESHWLEKRTV